MVDENLNLALTELAKKKKKLLEKKLNQLKEGLIQNMTESIKIELKDKDKVENSPPLSGRRLP